jgi:DedD protein
MDHELKQRLIGAVVVTALAAIFIPMLFDDPVDNSGKTVTELTIPQAPTDVTPEIVQKLPANKEQVLSRPEIELNAAEVDEEGHVNSTSEELAIPPSAGVQTEQQKMAKPATGSTGLDIRDAEPVEESSLDQSSQDDGEPSLDTGMKDEANQAKQSQDNTTKPIAVEKKPVAKTVLVEKPKAKVVAPAEKAVEKPSIAAKAPKETVKKSTSKLVRYSIQAGSFSKKENAQSLVEKLRKQGMPASIVTKGDLFRVKIGPALDKAKAKEMKAKLDKQNIKGLLTSE